MAILNATYSPEDNKLRIYTSERVSDDVYAKLKECGFKWAPIQKLFVAPAWSPVREDLCIELAGEIDCEETTMLERAEIKAARLDALAGKRLMQAGAFSDAARRLADRLSFGQPILIGHHSERKARKALDMADSQQQKALKAAEAVSYWHYRAEGVEHHANRKNKPAVRARRIKTLLAELRDLQRDVNHAFRCVDVWTKIDQLEDENRKRELTISACNYGLDTGSVAPSGSWSALVDGKKTHQEVIDIALAGAERMAFSANRARWIQHTLNRLAYERYELGQTARYSGELTEVVIKAFAREHGTHKPSCKMVEGKWELSSIVPLPVQIADGETLALCDDGWRDLMQALGYEVPDKKPAKAPILNFKAEAIKTNRFGTVKTIRQIELTKEEYSKQHSDSRGVFMSLCGQFRFKICVDPFHSGARWQADWVAVYLTDSKAHDVPESDAILHAEKLVA
jgi:hypothetical protein